MKNQTTIHDISRALRAIRISRKLSLSDVEKLSHGEIKAVVLGSYERGSRSLSVRRAITIADIYQIPLGHLLDPIRQSTETAISDSYIPQVIIDTRRLRAIEDSGDHQIALLARFIRRVTHLRQDWNGEVISLRGSDIAHLSLLIDCAESDCLQMLSDRQLLLRTKG
jgi:transcriptional regulator with XRE-family HTH domain